jgi:hypothetical protein
MVEGKTYRNENGIISLRRLEQARPCGVPVLFRTKVGALADGVIVDSACVKAIGGSKNPVEAAKQFAKSFAKALQSVRQ